MNRFFSSLFFGLFVLGFVAALLTFVPRSGNNLSTKFLPIFPVVQPIIP